MSFEWFHSFDEIGRVQWAPLIPIRRGALPGVDASPRVERLDVGDDGRSVDLVMWPTASRSDSFGSSEGPAAGHVRRLYSDRELSPEVVAKIVSEALALPGTRSDYHFAMLAAWGALHVARRRDHRAFGWIEALCLADIQLMEQGTQLVFEVNEPEASGGSMFVPAFEQLSSLYQHEGFLAGAVEVERRGAALGWSRPPGDSVISRQARLLEEDGL